MYANVYMQTGVSRCIIADLKSDICSKIYSKGSKTWMKFLAPPPAVLGFFSWPELGLL